MCPSLYQYHCGKYVIIVNEGFFSLISAPNFCLHPHISSKPHMWDFLWFHHKKPNTKEFVLLWPQPQKQHCANTCASCSASPQPWDMKDRLLNVAAHICRKVPKGTPGNPCTPSCAGRVCSWCLAAHIPTAASHQGSLKDSEPSSRSPGHIYVRNMTSWNRLLLEYQTGISDG